MSGDMSTLLVNPLLEAIQRTAGDPKAHTVFIGNDTSTLLVNPLLLVSPLLEAPNHTQSS